MAQNKRYIYNEHDQNQVHEILKKRKQKRRKKRIKRMSLVFVVIFIIGFFISDFSKIQSITIKGNTRITTKEIEEIIPIKAHSSIALFSSASTTESALEKTPTIKQAKVNKDFFGHVTITIIETAPIAYTYIDTILCILDEEGNVTKNEDNSLFTYVQRCPKLTGFDEARLKEFAKQYYKIPTQVQNQVSDIIYSPLGADPTRCEFVMDDAKILYLRIEDMAKQLAGDGYANILKKYPDNKYYDFMGDNCYVSD